MKIEDWKVKMEKDLPSTDQVIARNKAISATYAKIYQSAPHLFKWAGMAAFASYHIGMSLIPFKWTNLEIIDLPTAIERQNNGFKNDIQLIRLLNNKIFDDIAWIHVAYAQEGLANLKKILAGNKHYQPILSAFEQIHEGEQMLKIIGQEAAGAQLIWKANAQILWHEQAAVVQPIFNKLGDAFARAMTLCASFDYKISHTRTDWRTHSSFIIYMLFYGFPLVKTTGFMPIVTNLEHRWHWIENRLLNIWQETDRHDPNLMQKIEKLTTLSNNS